MFKIGDSVIHPQKGAGVIMDIKRMLKRKSNQRFYKIRIVGRANETTLLIPIMKAEAIGLRSAISPRELEEVWRALSDHPFGLPADHKARYKILEDKMDTGDIIKIAEVIRDLRWRLLQVTRLNTPAQRIYERAWQFLTGEIAVSQDIDVKIAEHQINNLLSDTLSNYIAHSPSAS